MKYSFTGHRPDKLGGYGNMALLERFAEHIVNRKLNAQEDQAIVGMAQGWDQAVARACIKAFVPFIASVPFVGQEYRWPAPARIEYHRLLRCASQVVVVSDGGYTSYKMHVRNAWMVDHSQKLISLWDQSEGGTANAVRYAIDNRVPYENVWDDWVRFWEAQCSTPLAKW